MPNESQIAQELKERVKELSCLYEISSTIRRHENSLEKTLGKICKIVRAAWLHPEEAFVEINLEQLHTRTGKIPKKNVFIEKNIHLFEEDKGAIRVYYEANSFSADTFLAEEEKLLEKVANEIGDFLEKLEIKKKEEILNRRIERNDRLSILGEITAGIAHELNTPIGNILGFAELIHSNTKNTQVKSDSSKIIKAATYSREVVKKLMFFACEMPQNRKFVKIEPIISQAISLLGPNLRKAGVTVSFEIENPDLEAQLDPIQFTQVLFNLLINAIFVSPKGSKIFISLTNSTEFFTMQIKDEGPGVSPENKTKIFEPFFTTKPTGEGSGLGLSVVHGIIKTHKGRISILDNFPTGAIFEIILPLKM